MLGTADLNHSTSAHVFLASGPDTDLKKKKSSPWVTVGAVMAVKAAVTEVVGGESLFLILWLSHRLMVKSLSFSIQMAERVFTLRNSDRSRSSSSSSSSCSNSIDSIPQSLLFFHRQSLYTIKKKLQDAQRSK